MDHHVASHYLSPIIAFIKQHFPTHRSNLTYHHIVVHLAPSHFKSNIVSQRNIILIENQGIENKTKSQKDNIIRTIHVSH